MELQQAGGQVTLGERPGVRERMGMLVGALCAPAVAVLARLRRTRMFHPAGHTFSGACVALPGPYAELGAQLAGNVLARFSAALWRRELHVGEVLGVALRFRGDRDPATEHADSRDQDLLAVTIRSPFTMLASPLLTDGSDFVHTKYWAVSPFQHAVGRVELRLRPLDRPPHARTRLGRLEAAVAAGRACWYLEARPTLRLGWCPVARIELMRRVELDQASLFFDPFRGVLQPVGLVHAIRHATYAASRRARGMTREMIYAE